MWKLHTSCISRTLSKFAIARSRNSLPGKWLATQSSSRLNSPLTRPSTPPPPPIVHTKYGPLEGFIYWPPSPPQHSIKNEQETYCPYPIRFSPPTRSRRSSPFVDIFLAIPYARPPVGALRMERPQSPEPWCNSSDSSGERKATGKHRHCREFAAGSISLNEAELTDEDSLVLNLFRPHNHLRLHHRHHCQEANNPSASSFRFRVKRVRRGGKCRAKVVGSEKSYLAHRSHHSQQQQLRPILIYFHGGSFCSGSTQAYGFEQWVENFVLPSQQNGDGVIFVTVQYRLGPLGFLTGPPSPTAGDTPASKELTSHHLPGNLGLWDQVKAIQFIYENARAFGGDPSRITVWGLSAGAASVSLLTLLPRCRSMLSSSIEMSGSAMAVWALSRADIVEASREFMTALGYKPKDKQGMEHNGENATNGAPAAEKELTEEGEGHEWKTMLKSASLEEIRKASFASRTCRKELNLLMYQPTIDGDLITADVHTLLNNEGVKRMPVLMGLTSSEGTYFTILGRDRYLNQFVVDRAEFSGYTAEDFESFVSKVIAPVKKFPTRQEALAAKREISDFYLGDDSQRDDDHFYLKAYTRMLSDAWFNVPTMWMAKERARLGWTVFLYHNAYFNDAQYPRWLPFRGATHANEYPYINGLFPVGRFDFNEADKKHRALLVKMVSSFVNTGSPSAVDPEWKPVLAGADSPLLFLKIDKHSGCSVGRVRELEESLAFWTRFAEKHNFNPLNPVGRVDQSGEKEEASEIINGCEKEKPTIDNAKTT